MINSNTRVFAVIGDPIEHSLSPLMQNWFIQKTGINAVYTAFHVFPENVKDCIYGMKAMGIAGLNVTAPHKQAVVKYSDKISDEVKLLGVSNTLLNNQGSISAFVTDPFGFIESLGENTSRFKDATVLLFGSGGASMSIVYGLSRLGVKQLYITDLFNDKAEKLKKVAVDTLSIPDVHVVTAGSENILEIIAESDVLINATAVGMNPKIEQAVISDFTSISKKHFVYDLIYNPGMTLFMQKAQEHGAMVQNGLEMLIFQGLESFRIFTGIPVQLENDELNELKSIMNKAIGL